MSTTGLSVLKKNVAKTQLDATSDELAVDLKKSGAHRVLIFSRHNPQTGLSEVIAIPFRKDDTLERLEELQQQISALIKGGFTSGAGTGDTSAIHKVSSGTVDQEIEF